MTKVDLKKLDLALAFGQISRELRERQGMTQTKLADALGIARRNYGRNESGRHTPSLENLVRFAVIMGREPGDVLTLVYERAKKLAGVGLVVLPGGRVD